MRIFVTGATGFIGSRIVPELISAGHQILGLTRSDEGSKTLTAAGAQFHRGDLGVVEEELVEVAHPEEEEGIRMLAFGRPELAHQRRLFQIALEC